MNSGVGPGGEQHHAIYLGLNRTATGLQLKRTEGREKASVSSHRLAGVGGRPALAGNGSRAGVEHGEELGGC